MQVAYPSLPITYRTIMRRHIAGHFLLSPQLLTRVSPRDCVGGGVSGGLFRFRPTPV